MRRLQTIIATLGALGIASASACGGKHDDAPPTSEAKSPPAPIKCPPGNAVQDGRCVAVTSAGQIAAVASQQSRIDDLGKLLDRVDTVGAPIELLNGLRQLEPWQQLKTKVAKLAVLDAVAGELDNAVKTLRTFRSGLTQASTRLGNLKGELDQLMLDTGATRQLADVRAQVSTAVRATLEPLAAQVQDTIRNALVPLDTQLTKVSALVIVGCMTSGGGDQMKALCAQAQDAFAKGRAYVDDLKTRPARLFDDVTAQLEAQLGQLVDRETQNLLATAQTKINAALELPPAAADPAGAGSATAGAAAASH